MIEFHAPTPADKAWVDELLARGNYRGCDYNFTNLYVWSRAYNQRIARVDDFLVTHVCGRLGCSYMYPAGSGDIAAVIRALEADAAEKGEPLRLVCLTPRQMAELEEFFPGRFAYTADRDGYDYLYEVERLADERARFDGAEPPIGASVSAPEILVDNIMTHRAYEHLSAGGLAQRTRAMLKVEDGCVNFCTYCIIPYARGPVRSLPLEDAVRQTEQLRREGYREVVFTGIEISSWGQDFKDGRSLIDLLEAVSQAAGEMRLRLGSLEPRTVTEDFCRRAARLPNLCPQFHLSMQSGCDATLRRMNRRYDTARFLRSVTLLRQYFPRPAITTDLICGFPGETEEEFSQTLAFLRRCDFAQMHIFPYSIRPGTKAAEMEQVPGPVKEERAARASAVAAELHRAYLQGCVGQTYPVLFEQRKDGCAAGHAPNYMPVEVQTQGDYHNTVRHVKITGVVNDILMGEVT